MDAEIKAGPTGAIDISLTVNGTPHRLTCQPTDRLTDLLRDRLALTGTKVGCNAGDCGACTVLLDDEQVCACLVPAAQCDGARVTTVEGLGRDGGLSDLQRAFADKGAAQCGICTPGMLMAAADLLRRDPNPTESDVEAAIGGVLCRCTGYRKIIEAVLSVGQGGGLPDDPPAGQAVGARALRRDAIPKVTGAEPFGADRAPAEALWLRAIRSPHARARFVLGDLDAVRAAHPGLVAILTARDVPENSFAVFPTPKDQPVLADGHVRFRGEAVLALVGTRDAVEGVDADALPIRWTPLPALRNVADALAHGAPALHDFAPDNVLCRGNVRKGDAEAALEQAAHVATGACRTAYVEHGYIEPEAGYAETFVEDGIERIRVWACTQSPYMDRDEVARVLKLPPERVHILPSAIGGGFGGKLDVSVQPLLAVAAWTLKRPVRMIYSRPESMASTTKRHPADITARLGCDAQGRLIALDFHGDFNTGAYASWGSTVANRVPVHATGPYLVPHVKATTRAVFTNDAIAGAFRGFGLPQAVLVTEALMDDLAAATKLDPLDFRVLNALRPGDSTATGQKLSTSVGQVACLEALRAPWRAARARTEAWNAEAATAGFPRRRGVGVACLWYGIGNTSIPNPSIMTAGLRRDGRLVLFNGAQEIGQGAGTIMAQIFADAVGAPLALVDQVLGDTDLTEDAGKSSASRQTFVSGNAARFAGDDLRAAVLKLMGLSARASLRFEPGVVIGTEDNRETRLNLTDLPADRNGCVATGRGRFDPPTTMLDANGQGVPYATFAFAAQMAEIEVDLELGTISVLQIHAAHDVGRAINPTLVEGQIHGGIAQGLGLALMEEYVGGRTDNLHDYLMPTAGDVPPITVHLIEDAEPIGPFGAKGVGEPALIATAPAILNALHHAAGIRLSQVPATPDRVRATLLAREESMR